MSTLNPPQNTKPILTTLPGDDIRQIMWRFQDRYDLQMVVQSARSVARGPVARLVAGGERHSHEWTKGKADLLAAFDEAGITAVFMDPKYGGFIEGPKNLALALVAFELSWVDAGAATSSLAGNLGLAPIHEKGTPEQKDYYMSRCIPPQTGENRKSWRAAFVLTEPIPYVGVDTGVLSGKVRIAQWNEGEEPILQVEKRGRFITNMGFANFVTAAVDSDDPKIKGSCMVILEHTDPGTFDSGSPTHKLVHQLSSTCDPIFNLKVPASRIVGGYTIRDGVIIPNFSHGEVIESVFRRTRVTVGLMTSAKLLSAVEPVIRYQRSRFRGGTSATPGTPRYELGLQQKEDVLHRLVDIWATGEASASLGFATARMFDAYDAVEKEKDRIFEEQAVKGPRAQMKVLKTAQAEALEYLELLKKSQTRRSTDSGDVSEIASVAALPRNDVIARSPKDDEAISSMPGNRTDPRLKELEHSPLVKFVLMDSVTNVLCPACKLWNTGHGANMMREAVSLMGGYGITEDCPGFLGHKWMDAQLEATYEGPEAVQRRQLSITMTHEVFLAQFRDWIGELREIASKWPGTGACTLASAMELWLWTLQHLLTAQDADGKELYHGQRHGVTFPMADALCWLLASRSQILDVIELEEKGSAHPMLQEAIGGFVHFFTDLCHVQAASAAGESSRVSAELVFGYNRHPTWEDDLIPSPSPLPQGEGKGDVDHRSTCSRLKAGPCVCFRGYEEFVRLRSKLDGCLTGSRIAKDRAAHALSQVTIPEALDYPV